MCSRMLIQFIFGIPKIREIMFGNFFASIVFINSLLFLAADCARDAGFEDLVEVLGTNTQTDDALEAVNGNEVIIFISFVYL